MALMNKDEIIEILKIVAESTVDELHLESDGLKLSIKKYARGEAAPEADTGTEAFEKAQVARAEKRALAPAPEKKPAPEVPAKKERAAPVPEVEGFTSIRAPMLGTFYRAPKPDAPPFVEVGQWVTEEDVVCIIEVMKLFNTVKAGVRGRIAKICAENAEMVEYKQVLFLIEEGSEKGKREQSA